MTCPVHSPFDAQGLVGLGKAPTDRARAWKQFEARRQPFYGPMSRKAKKARDEVAEAAIEQVRSSMLPRFAPRAAEGTIRKMDGVFRDLLDEIYRTVGARFAVESFNELKSLDTKEDPPDSWFQEVARFLQEVGAEEVRRIAETTRKDIVGILEDAREDGLGVEEMAKLLEDEISEVNRRRGRVIARTEVITASNKASQHGAKQTGLTLEKEWFDSNDARVRRSHRAVDGQRVPMDDVYTWTSPEVGQVSARFPADPQLPAAERINCRCVELHHPV